MADVGQQTFPPGLYAKNVLTHSFTVVYCGKYKSDEGGDDVFVI